MTLCLRQNDLHWREIDDEIVVLDEREAQYLAVHGSGVLVWRLLAQRTTREDVIDALIDTYGVDREVAAADLDAFVDKLTERDFLVT